METQEFKNAGRNDPCPCGSNKKFKKCHGENTPWQGNVKAEAPADASTEGAAPAETMPQFDPSKMDLNWLSTFSGAIQRLPKGQLQQLQALMQKAMIGKDVSRELEEFQRKLPPSFQEMLKKSPELEAQMENAQGSTPAAPLSDEQKKQLADIQKNNEKAGLSRLWSKFRKK